ncbi:hypothetical protein [Amycolatopsis anabasis]|nr:hypothetical protein [Amycolatopsis anabasis]
MTKPAVVAPLRSTQQAKNKPQSQQKIMTVTVRGTKTRSKLLSNHFA